MLLGFGEVVEDDGVQDGEGAVVDGVVGMCGGGVIDLRDEGVSGFDLVFGVGMVSALTPFDAIATGIEVGMMPKHEEIHDVMEVMVFGAQVMEGFVSVLELLVTLWRGGVEVCLMGVKIGFMEPHRDHR